MSNELAKIPNITPGTVSVMTPQGYEAALGLAKTLCDSGFLPRAIQRPAQALAIILAGQELGLPPMQSLRQIHVVEGKPVLSAELMLSLFKRQGGQAKWVESTDDKAVLFLRHPNGDEHTESFTMQEAQRAGVTGKDNWRKYPKAMLKARCISAGIRALGEAAGFYMPEEVGGEPAPEDMKPEYTAPKEEAPSLPPSLAVVPPATEAEEEEADPSDTVECFKLYEEGHKKNNTYRCEWVPAGMQTRRTEAQHIKLQQGRRELGIEDDEWRSDLQTRYGKETSKNLSVDEADDLLAHLRKRWNQRKYKHPKDKAAAKEQRAAPENVAPEMADMLNEREPGAEG